MESGAHVVHDVVQSTGVPCLYQPIKTGHVMGSQPIGKDQHLWTSFLNLVKFDYKVDEKKHEMDKSIYKFDKWTALKNVLFQKVSYYYRLSIFVCSHYVCACKWLYSVSLLSIAKTIKYVKKQVVLLPVLIKFCGAKGFSNDKIHVLSFVGSLTRFLFEFLSSLIHFI